MNTQSIKTVAVLGLGTMGHGIAQAFASAGFEVRCFDTVDTARDNLHDRILANLEQVAPSDGGDSDFNNPQFIDETLARVTVVDSEPEAVGPAQFVTEAVSEDLAVKQELFARIESFASPEALLVSNTSSFPMTKMAARMQRPERSLVTHWFNPPHIVPVVEVVAGQKTTDETTQTTAKLLERIGKLPIVLHREIPGFLVNRVQIAMIREVWNLLEQEVASPQDIDRAIRGSVGLRLATIGPLEVCDFAGLDIYARVYENLVTEVCSHTQLPASIRGLVEAGHFGTKTGKGVFQYTPESVEEKRSRRDRQYAVLAKLQREAGP